MKLLSILLVTVASAAPLSLNLGLVSLNIGGSNNGLISLNIGNSGSSNPPSQPSDPTLTRDDLINGDPQKCPKAILIFARGSEQKGNLGSLGPLIASRLEQRFSNNGGVWIQGVGRPYTAALLDNALPRGTTNRGIAEMARLFKLAYNKCPNAQIVAGGYSQGAALAAAAITSISATPLVEARIAGVVLFGYTKNKQNHGTVPRYPAGHTRIFCDAGDLVCQGTLIVTDAHFGYGPAAQGPGADFLISVVN